MKSSNNQFDIRLTGIDPGPSRLTDCKRILVPVTLSRTSGSALALARYIARESGARLILLHVVQLNIAGEERGIERTRLLNDLCRDAEMQLKQLAAIMGGSGTASVAVCDGEPTAAIVETARRLEVDAIMLNTHGGHGWLAWLHRNIASRLVREAPAPCGLSPRPFRINLSATARSMKTKTRFDRSSGYCCPDIGTLLPAEDPCVLILS